MWVSSFSLGIFLLVPLFPTRASLFLVELSHPVQGHQASKETNSKMQTLPNGEQCLVEQTKIREWLEKRAGVRWVMDGLCSVEGLLSTEGGALGDGAETFSLVLSAAAILSHD